MLLSPHPLLPVSAIAERLALLANGQRIVAEAKHREHAIRALVAQSRRQLEESYRLLKI